MVGSIRLTEQSCWVGHKRVPRQRRRGWIPVSAFSWLFCYEMVFSRIQSTLKPCTIKNTYRRTKALAIAQSQFVTSNLSNVSRSKPSSLPPRNGITSIRNPPRGHAPMRFQPPRSRPNLGFRLHNRPRQRHVYPNYRPHVGAGALPSVVGGRCQC